MNPDNLLRDNIITIGEDGKYSVNHKRLKKFDLHTSGETRAFIRGYMFALSSSVKPYTQKHPPYVTSSKAIKV